MKNLPDFCYSVGLVEGDVIILKHGEFGYHQTDILTKSREESESVVNERNAILEVSMAERKAMEMGTMFGWDSPAASAEFWEAKGF